jgi:hypothetical protein
MLEPKKHIHLYATPKLIGVELKWDFKMFKENLVAYCEEHVQLKIVLECNI